MPKPKEMKEGFVRVPNRLIRSAKLDVYDKTVLLCLASCGEKAFPSYEKLMEWCCCGRKRVWKALRNLEKRGLIVRRRHGYRIFYHSYYWSQWPSETDGGRAVAFPAEIVSHGNEPGSESVSQGNDISFPRKRRVVSSGNRKKKNQKEQIKTEPLVSVDEPQGARLFSLIRSSIKGIPST